MKRLSEYEEKLLIRYLDQETWFLEDVLARLILKTKPSAASFLRSLQQTSRIVSESDLSSANVVDMWSRIERRIVQEEKAAFFLGERRSAAPLNEKPLSDLFGRVFNKSLFGGMAVGVATAALAFMFIEGSGKGSTPSVGTMANNVVQSHNVASNVEFVSYPERSRAANVRSRSSNSSSYLNQRSSRVMKRMEIPFEVDWMRSDGQVKFIQDPRQGSTVIWVKRGNEVVGNRPVVLEAEPKLLE